MKKLQTSVIGAISGLLLSGVGIVKDNNFITAIGLGIFGTGTILTAIEEKKQPIQIQQQETPFIATNSVTRVYIDGANSFGTPKNLQLKVDFKKLVNTITKDDAVFKYYYAVSNPQTTQETSFIKYLEKNGYEVVKCTKKMLPNGNYVIKGDDTQITMNISDEAQPKDHIILVSGDGDFKCVLEKIKAKGCQITVIASAHSFSQQLKKLADNIIKIEDVKDDFKCQDKPSNQVKSSNKSQAQNIVKPKIKTCQKPQNLPELKRPKYLPKST